MPWTDAVRNAQAGEDATRVATVSLHTADPGATGANEATGGGYARVAPTFAAAGVDGPLGVADQPAASGVAWGEVTLTVAAGDYPYWGAWSSGGVFLGGFAVLPSPVSLAADGTSQISVYTGSQPAS